VRGATLYANKALLKVVHIIIHYYISLFSIIKKIKKKIKNF